MMTQREDFLAAINKEQPLERVPLWELEFHIWDKFSRNRLLVGTEFTALSKAEKEHAIYNNAEIFVSVSEQLNFAALTLPSQFWEVGPGFPAYYWLPEEWRNEQTRAVRKLAPDTLLLVANCSALLGMPMGEDYVPFAYRLFDDPDGVQQEAEQKLQEGIDAAARFADLGVEIGLSTSDLADNHNTFMNPRQLERFIWPYLARWAGALKSLGMKSILHSDGKLTACVDQIADSGVDCLQAIDPTAGMDMAWVKEKVRGRICLSGNVAVSTLVSGTPEDVYQITQDLLIRCKEGGGLILGASNAVQREVPIENYRAQIDAWKAFGPYSEP